MLGSLGKKFKLKMGYSTRLKVYLNFCGAAKSEGKDVELVCKYSSHFTSQTRCCSESTEWRFLDLAILKSLSQYLPWDFDFCADTLTSSVLVQNKELN